MTTQCDLLIRNGTCVLPGGAEVEGLAVAINGDTIAAIGRPDQLPRGHVEIDAAGQHVLPGFIDAHVHTRDPGWPEKEDLHACSVAGAAGGVTTMIAMFNVDPMVRDVPSYRSFIDYCATKSVINFNINAVLSQGHLEHIPELVEAGVASFKIVLGYKYDVSGGTGRADSKAIVTPDDGHLLEAMRILSRHGVTLVAHAENDDIIRWHQDVLKAAGDVGPMAHIKSRPRIAEVEAISRLILFSRETGCHVHILHLGNGDGVQLIQQAQADGVRVSAETCPHFLLLSNSEVLPRLGGVAKTNPPIRGVADHELLWRGIQSGAITTIGSDHAPHTSEEKMVHDPLANLFDVYAGWPGIETVLPLMLTQVNEGRLTLGQLADLYSTNVAKRFGMYPRLGLLQPGSQADITIVDMHATGVIEGERLHSKNTDTPFEGTKVQGLPTHTIVSGRIVYTDGEVLAGPGTGSWIPSRHTADPDRPGTKAFDRDPDQLFFSYR